MSGASPSLGMVFDLSHAGFAAVLNAGATMVAAHDVRRPGTRHEDAAEWTETLLRQAGGGFGDLAWICVGIGPGSFTGIRIAMAFAQGLALPRSIPLHGFTTFEALRLSYKGPAPAVAVIPANAGRFYASFGARDEGKLLEAEELFGSLPAGAIGLAPAIEEDLERAFRGHAGLWAPGTEWDAISIAREARASGRGVDRPVYLQLSAAEAAHVARQAGL